MTFSFFSLEIYQKYNIKSTFFFTGYIAEKFPEVVSMIIPYGHEVASHGYSHDFRNAFDVMPLNKQIDHMKRSKHILENICGSEVISFRAPSARVNYNTPIALRKAGFKIDSSVASQRFDMFLTFGGIKKLNWLFSPRLPYFTDPKNLWKRGNGEIFEIPISAFIIPYIGTTLRLFPSITKLIRNILNFETKLNNKPIVYLTHPNEFIDEPYDHSKFEKRGKTYISHLLGDVIKHRLKVKNLGEKAIPLYEKEIDFFYRKSYRFISCKEYYENYINQKT